MNAWQVSQQIKFMLQKLQWSGDTNEVFGTVAVTHLRLRDLVGQARLPAAFIRPRRVIADPEFPEIVNSQSFEIELVDSNIQSRFDESSIIGGARPDLTTSSGRGVDELLYVVNNALKENNPETGFVVVSKFASAAAVTSISDRMYASRTVVIDSRGGTQPYYSPGRFFTNTGGTLTWTNAAARFDFHDAVANLSARGSVVLRYAAGSTPPATVTAGTAATLSGNFATSYTHGDDSQGSGTFSYSLFMGYDFRGQGLTDAASSALTITASF